MFLACLLIGLLAPATQPDSTPPPTPIEAEQAPAPWNGSLQGSAVAAATGRMARGRRFQLASPGSGPASSVLRAWGEAQFAAHRQWDLDSQSLLRIRFFTSPLLEVGTADSSSSSTPWRFWLREAWTRLEWLGAPSLAIGAGRQSVEPGAGLASHPARVLPLAPPAPDVQAPDERHPWQLGLSGTWSAGMRTDLRFFPRLAVTGPWLALADDQRPLLRLEQTFRLPPEQDVRLEAGMGSFTSVGASWEWNSQGWFLSAEGASRDDLHPARPVREADGGWTTESSPNKMRHGIALVAQRDFVPPVVGQMRLSVEWSLSSWGWSRRESRQVASDLQAMTEVASDDPRFPGARRTLGEFARQSHWIDGYAQRLLLRAGSVQSMRWGGGLNLLLIGPLEGDLLQLEAHGALGDQWDLDGTLTWLAWARSGSLVSQLPVSSQAQLALRWSW